MLIYGQDVALAKWAGDRLGIQDWGPARAIGVVRHGSLAAVAVFHHYRHPDIEISFVTAHKGWATPQVVRGILRYPFIQLGCKRLTAITGATNQPTSAFLCRLGFRQEGIHPDVFLTEDAISYGLLRRDAAKWLKEKECSENVAPGSAVSDVAYGASRDAKIAA